MNINVQKVPAEHSFAVRSQELIRQDLFEMGLVDPKLSQYANPDDDELVGRQLKNLAEAGTPEHPDKLYCGAYDQDSLEGILKLNEWFRRDQYVYDEQTFLAKAALELAIRTSGHSLPERPMGIFHISPNYELTHDDQEEVMTAMVEAATNTADEAGREMRTQARVRDSLATKAYRDGGFVPTGLFGKPLAGREQQLWVRPKQ